MSIKIKATSPCMKFINATPEEQMAKIREEVEKAAAAWAAFEKEKTRENLRTLFVELLDVKACINTAREQIFRAAAAENDRIREGSVHNPNFLDYIQGYRIAKNKVVEKNLQRGYYCKDSNKNIQLPEKYQPSNCDGNLTINKDFQFKNGDIYYSMGILGTGEVYIAKIEWDGSQTDYIRRAAGIIYRTEEEVKEHLLADYNRLTGKKLESIELME